MSWVVKDGRNGVTFDWAEEGSCSAAIRKMLEGEGFATPESISTMAWGTISGEAGAGYFMKIMDSVYNGKEKPPIPWE